jgi:predicted Rossmann-fold nucleotide-binding protein
MGVVADTVLAAGGEVVGVIPQQLVDKEVAHRSLSDLRVTASMHERKALMAELSDGFVALPGVAMARWRSSLRSSPGPSSGCSTSRAAC